MRGNCEWNIAAVAVAVSLGTDFISGRALAAFYAQMGKASWLGIAAAALLFGSIAGFFAYLARRQGAHGMLELLQRMPGGRMGWLPEALYAAILISTGCMMVASAGHIGALTLPVRNGALLAGALCILLSGAIVLSGTLAVQLLCRLFLLCTGVFLAALLLFGRTDDGLMKWAVDLRLRGSFGTALAFGALHASVGACVSSGAIMRLIDGKTRPVRLGACAALLQLMLLGLGNGALRIRSDEALVLKLPFVALASRWGNGGFWCSALLMFLAAVITFSGILLALIPKRKCPDFIEK